ncbi:MAG: PEPxxWA-CTERM sorting domain-containing protein [Sphingomonas sp.]|nr:PEPxxWA-CTERM sorting domain-containing protein [Sphingomonas sp.]
MTQNFVAGGTSQTLSFLSNGTPNGLPPVALLDNVSLTAAVPEPASWALMIVGFGAMGYSLRRRRETALQTA